MADIIDFENQFNKFFGKNAASQFNEDTLLEEVLEATPTGELIEDVFNFMDVLKEYAMELELRGFEVVVVSGLDDDLASVTIGVRQIT